MQTRPYNFMWDILHKGDTVLLHSSIRRTCHTHGMTPNDVVESLLDALGPEGTLVLPTFTYDGWCHGEAFDVLETPSRMGALSEAGRLYPGAIRTGNPMYSFAAIGREAISFTCLDNKSGYGHDSPFALLRDMGAKVAVLDLSENQSMTYVHHVEEMHRVYYRKMKDFRGDWTGWNGETAHDKTYTLFVRDLELGWHTNVEPLGDLAWQNGIWKGVRAGVGDGLRVADIQQYYALTSNVIGLGYERKYLGYIQ